MTKRFLSMFLALVTTLSLTVPAFAAEDTTGDHIGEEESAASAWNPGFNQICYDGYGNQYTPAVFPTLKAAKAYFGGDYTYVQCYKEYGGGSFNCYYSFSDDTRCYFNIREWF